MYPSFFLTIKNNISIYILFNVCVSHLILARSERIVQLARKYNLLVVCDDVYNLLYFPDAYRDGKCSQRLFAYDKK